MRTRIKICGITDPEDARQVAAAGIDAIGLVFHPASPRHVTADQAAAVINAVPPFISVVGLFLNPGADAVRDVLRRLPIDQLQFHGTESAAFCRQFGRRYVKALGMAGDVTELDARVAEHGDASGFLLDSHAPGEQGGTGRVFDWGSFPRDYPRPLVLAGGLRCDNVAAAVRQCRPFAVDVSSGVEREPGRKCPEQVSQFVSEVRRGEDD
ncbi:phosphoribosylanthranilate isomerase [Methylonatrum kenyense]|uniref:phosphoribosylanthranilate isomerase n=1 Tax=Methylonatrum kenyense TaxID=455253 RepID=UPI0020BF2A73|nr:phosphoribosylanthranilate isomerase [Methylonatrum kenyense]